ncbi:MAG: META domain-containing protein [Chloroflexota bacterium]
MNAQRTILWWSITLVVCLVMVACGATNAGNSETGSDDSAQSNEDAIDAGDTGSGGDDGSAQSEEDAMEATDGLAGTEWQLVEYGTPDNVQTTLGEYQPTIQFDGASLNGNASCNTYGGDYTSSGSDLTVADLFATEMACADQSAMDQEIAYLELLSTVQTFTLADGKLTLTSPDGTLFFEPLQAAESQPLEGVVWELETLVTFEGDAVVAQPSAEDTPITAFLQDGTMQGDISCNTYGVPYQLSDAQIVVTMSEFATTEGGCSDTLEQTLQFMDGMEAIESYEIIGDVLTITYPEGELVFRAQDGTGTDPNAVYEAFLRQWQGEREAFVVLNETRFNVPDQDMDATIETLQELPPISDEVAPLDETLLTDFREKNDESQSLDGTFSIDFPTIFMSQSDIDDIFVDGEEAGWQTFNERFGNTDGYIALSNVGFSEGGNEALAYLELHSPNDTAGFYNRLFLQNGTWVVIQSDRIWGDE